MPANRIIRITVTKDNGEPASMEFEDSAKGQAASMKFLEQLKTAHLQHAYFTHPAYKACDKDVKRIWRDPKIMSTSKRAEIEKAEASRDAELKAEGLIKPKLAVVSEFVKVEGSAHVTAFDRPARKRLAKRSALPAPVENTRAVYFAIDELRKQYGEERLGYLLNGLKDPAVAKELDLVIELNEMLK